MGSTGQNHNGQLPWAVGSMNEGGLYIRRFTGTGNKGHARGNAFGLLVGVPFQQRVKLIEIRENLFQPNHSDMDGRQQGGHCEAGRGGFSS